jgi:hypothetical protein
MYEDNSKALSWTNRRFEQEDYSPERKRMDTLGVSPWRFIFSNFHQLFKITEDLLNIPASGVLIILVGRFGVILIIGIPIVICKHQFTGIRICLNEARRTACRASKM